MNILVSIIIVNWNGEKYLRDCLESLHNQGYCDYKIILVDNGSTDDSVQFVKDHFPDVNICALERNYGFAKGNNIGIKCALERFDPEYLLLLNNDTRIDDRNFLTGLIAAAEDEKEAGIVGCKIVFPDGRTQHLGTRIGRFSWDFIKQEMSHPYDVDSIMGSVFLIRRAVVEKIGLLDEGFSPFLHEETDYCLRAKRAGFRVKVIPTLKVIHYWSGSMNKVPSSEVLLYLYKNSIRLRLLNESLFLLAPKLALNFCSCILERDNNKMLRIKVREHFMRNVLTYSKAVILNIRALPEMLKKRYHRTARLWF